MRHWLVVLLATGCVQQVPRGPALGDCAEVPEGSYTYGDAGIGRCIAGPADLEFFTKEGRNYLALSNVDQYRNFQTGSVLVIDWTSLEEDVLDPRGPQPLRIPAHELNSVALEIFDDDNGDGEGENAWLGGLGYLEGFDRLVVTSRLSEDSNIRSSRDELFVLDTAGIANDELSVVGSPIVLEDDPFLVQVQSAAERFFVGNLTDHSISVVSSGADPEPIDIAGDAFAGDVGFLDADDSGSIADIVQLQTTDPLQLEQEAFTLTFVDASVRLFAPTRDLVEDGVDENGDPVFELSTATYRRYSSGGGPYVASAIEEELGLAGLNDPVFSMSEEGIPTFIAVEPGRRSIVTGVGGSVVGSWGLDEVALLRGPEGTLIGSPSITSLEGSVGLFYELREAFDAPASIQLALSSDGVTFSPEGTIISSEDESRSYEDPWVVFDTLALTWRMWLSVRELNDPDDPSDDEWAIGLTHSDDGLTWPTPTIVARGAGGASLAAPTVLRLEQRYGMWATQWNGTQWDHTFSWSWDGWQWSEPVVVVAGQVPSPRGVPELPDRPGVLLENVGAWRLEGRDLGNLQAYVRPGLGANVDFELGFELALASGHAFGNDLVPDQHATNGVVPGSVVEFEGRRLLFATTEASSGRRRIAALEQSPDEEWSLLATPASLEDMLRPSDSMDEVFAPVVGVDGTELVMIYSLLNANSGGRTVARATSTDGVNWTRVSGDVFSNDAATFDSAYRTPHSIEELEDGVRLWYTGSDGTTTQIGSALADDLRGTFSREGAGPRLQIGIPGSFDDVGLRDPTAVRIGDQTHLYYAGYDGLVWSIGHALVLDSGSLERRIDDLTLGSLPAMRGQGDTFSEFGVHSPVVLSQTEEEVRFVHAGSDFLGAGLDRLDSTMDELIPRVGLAVVNPATPEQMFPQQRFPTAGDELTFRTERGGDGVQVIELAQRSDLGSFSANLGTGMSSLELDEDRGFLYVTSKLWDEVLVIDVRDDTGSSFVDSNYLDVESAIELSLRSANSGVISAKLIPSRDLLALTLREPEGIALVDLTKLVDDDTKERTRLAAVTVLPLSSRADDAGDRNFAALGGAGMALTEDERTLLVTHFNGNALAAYDLELGAWGAQTDWIRDVGEGPHVVAISPTNKYAVVANYIGELDGETATGSLAVIDLSTSDDRHLEIAAWLVNR